MLASCEEYSGNITQGEVPMEETNYMSKEEFIEYIETHDVDITVDDLSNIDVDDFLCFLGYTSGMVFSEDYSFKLAIRFYLNNLEHRVFEPFMAKEIISVPSTDIEYEDFKGVFLGSIDKPYEFRYTDDFGLDTYNIVIEQKNYQIKIGQTQNLDKCHLEKTHDGFYGVYYKGDPGVTQPIIYSKNHKYFILRGYYDELENEFVKAFCSIDD